MDYWVIRPPLATRLIAFIAFYWMASVWIGCHCRRLEARSDSLGVPDTDEFVPAPVTEKPSETDVDHKAGTESRLRKLLQSMTLAEDCRASIEHCLAQPKGETDNCKEDVLDCVKDTVVGPATAPRYADLGPDIDLSELLRRIAAEVRLPDETTVAKKVLNKCLGVKSSPWRTLIERVAVDLHPPSPAQAHEFVCGIFLGEDQGTFPDVASAPVECNYAVARTICNRRVPRPSLGTIFTEWYPKLGVPGESKTFPDCWEHQDRGSCIAAIMLGDACSTTCATATCVYHRLRDEGNSDCLEKLNKDLDVYFLAAANQCQRLAQSVGAPQPMETCPKPSDVALAAAG